MHDAAVNQRVVTSVPGNAWVPQASRKRHPRKKVTLGHSEQLTYTGGLRVTRDREASSLLNAH
eukprot:2706939-Pleurochrysis_carterae.AAC.6